MCSTTSEASRPRAQARTRATKHALLNSAALGLFAASWLLGRRPRRRLLPLALQGVASAAMSVAGYLGGTLVFRNQIGVDHRYANAGTWREDLRSIPAAPISHRSAPGLTSIR
jgi:hypothetical protein